MHSGHVRDGSGTARLDIGVPPAQRGEPTGGAVAGVRVGAVLDPGDYPTGVAISK